MAIIVQHIFSQERAILLGTGYGTFTGIMPSLWWGKVSPRVESGSLGVVSICDREGNIKWVRSIDVKVIEVDGKPVNEYAISKNTFSNELKSNCSACNMPLKLGISKCSHCHFEN